MRWMILASRLSLVRIRPHVKLLTRLSTPVSVLKATLEMTVVKSVTPVLSWSHVSMVIAPLGLDLSILVTALLDSQEPTVPVTLMTVLLISVSMELV